jgi:choline dehydrogenase
MPWHLLNYLLFGRGVLTAASVHGMASFRSRPALTQPNIKLQFIPLWMDRATGKTPPEAGVSISANVSPPKSRGEIRLRSSDPDAPPIIDHRLFGDPSDMSELVAAVKVIEKIYATPAFSKYVTGRNAPRTLPKSDGEWAAFIRSTIGVGYHPIGSCRMGADERSVVDTSLRVRGITGLRVIDASVMPGMPTANTNAPTMMVAEKGADLIRQDA